MIKSPPGWSCLDAVGYTNRFNVWFNDTALRCAVGDTDPFRVEYRQALTGQAAEIVRALSLCVEGDAPPHATAFRETEVPLVPRSSPFAGQVWAF